MNNPGSLFVKDLNPNLICILCGGYFIDATTVVECLHSYCKSCIIRYLETSKFCPTCDVLVHKSNPLLGVKTDKTLQDLVYKIIPKLYQNEICRKRKFCTKNTERNILIGDTDWETIDNHLYVLPDDVISVALRPTQSSGESKEIDFELLTRFFNCPATVQITQLKKLLRGKFDLPRSHPIIFLTPKNETLKEYYSLIDVAYILSWKKNEPLVIHYKICFSKRIKFDPEIVNRRLVIEPKCDQSTYLLTSNEMPKLEPQTNIEPQFIPENATIPLLSPIKIEVDCSPVTAKSDITTSSLYRNRKVKKELEIISPKFIDIKPLLSTYKAIVPAPVKFHDHMTINHLQMPTIDSFSGINNCLNYGINLLGPQHAYNGISTGTVLPYGITLAPNIIYASFSDQANLNILATNSGNNNILPLPSFETTVVPSGTQIPIPSIISSTVETGIKVNKRPQLIKPKENPLTALAEEKVVQLMISESGVMIVSGGDIASDQLERVCNPVQSEANELLSKIENESMIQNPDSYSEDSSKSDESDCTDKLSQIKQEISSILDTLSKEVSTCHDLVPQINSTGSCQTKITPCIPDALPSSDYLPVHEILNINNNIITEKMDIKTSKANTESSSHSLSSLVVTDVPYNKTFGGIEEENVIDFNISNELPRFVENNKHLSNSSVEESVKAIISDHETLLNISTQMKQSISTKLVTIQDKKLGFSKLFHQSETIEQTPKISLVTDKYSSQLDNKLKLRNILDPCTFKGNSKQSASTVDYAIGNEKNKVAYISNTNCSNEQKFFEKCVPSENEENSKKCPEISLGDQNLIDSYKLSSYNNSDKSSITINTGLSKISDIEDSNLCSNLKKSSAIDCQDFNKIVQQSIIKSDCCSSKPKSMTKVQFSYKNENFKGKSKKLKPLRYKTLKNSPKGWNPTISREKLTFRNNSLSLTKTNKFFKARNNVSALVSDVLTSKPNTVSNTSDHASNNMSDSPLIISDNVLDSQTSSCIKKQTIKKLSKEVIASNAKVETDCLVNKIVKQSLVKDEDKIKLSQSPTKILKDDVSAICQKSSFQDLSKGSAIQFNDNVSNIYSDIKNNAAVNENIPKSSSSPGSSNRRADLSPYADEMSLNPFAFPFSIDPIKDAFQFPSSSKVLANHLDTLACLPYIGGSSQALMHTLASLSSIQYQNQLRHNVPGQHIAPCSSIMPGYLGTSDLALHNSNHNVLNPKGKSMKKSHTDDLCTSGKSVLSKLPEKNAKEKQVLSNRKSSRQVGLDNLLNFKTKKCVDGSEAKQPRSEPVLVTESDIAVIDPIYSSFIKNLITSQNDISSMTISSATKKISNVDMETGKSYKSSNTDIKTKTSIGNILNSRYDTGVAQIKDVQSKFSTAYISPNVNQTSDISSDQVILKETKMNSNIKHAASKIPSLCNGMIKCMPNKNSGDKVRNIDSITRKNSVTEHFKKDNTEQIANSGIEQLKCTSSKNITETGQMNATEIKQTKSSLDSKQSKLIDSKQTKAHNPKLLKSINSNSLNLTNLKASAQAIDSEPAMMTTTDLKHTVTIQSRQLQTVVSDTKSAMIIDPKLTDLKSSKNMTAMEMTADLLSTEIISEFASMKANNVEVNKIKNFENQAISTEIMTLKDCQKSQISDIEMIKNIDTELIRDTTDLIMTKETVKSDGTNTSKTDNIGFINKNIDTVSINNLAIEITKCIDTGPTICANTDHINNTCNELIHITDPKLNKTEELKPMKNQGTELKNIRSPLTEDTANKMTKCKDPQLIENTNTELFINTVNELLKNHDPGLTQNTGSELAKKTDPDVVKGTDHELVEKTDPELVEKTEPELLVEKAHPELVKKIDPELVTNNCSILTKNLMKNTELDSVMNNEISLMKHTGAKLINSEPVLMDKAESELVNNAPLELALRLEMIDNTEVQCNNNEKIKRDNSKLIPKINEQLNNMEIVKFKDLVLGTATEENCSSISSDANRCLSSKIVNPVATSSPKRCVEKSVAKHMQEVNVFSTTENSSKSDQSTLLPSSFDNLALGLFDSFDSEQIVPNAPRLSKSNAFPSSSSQSSLSMINTNNSQICPSSRGLEKNESNIGLLTYNPVYESPDNLPYNYQISQTKSKTLASSLPISTGDNSNDNAQLSLLNSLASLVNATTLKSNNLCSTTSLNSSSTNLSPKTNMGTSKIINSSVLKNDSTVSKCAVTTSPYMIMQPFPYVKESESNFIMKSNTTQNKMFNTGSKDSVNSVDELNKLLVQHEKQTISPLTTSTTKPSYLSNSNVIGDKPLTKSLQKSSNQSIIPVSSENQIQKIVQQPVLNVPTSRTVGKDDKLKESTAPRQKNSASTDLIKTSVAHCVIGSIPVNSTSVAFASLQNQSDTCKVPSSSEILKVSKSNDILQTSTNNFVNSSYNQTNLNSSTLSTSTSKRVQHACSESLSSASLSTLSKSNQAYQFPLSFNSNHAPDSMSSFTNSTSSSSGSSHKNTGQLSWDAANSLNSFLFNKEYPNYNNYSAQHNLFRSSDSFGKDASSNANANFMNSATSNAQMSTKFTGMGSQYDSDCSSKKTTNMDNFNNNFGQSASFHNSCYNNNYMNFFSSSQATTPSLTSLVSGTGYNFPISTNTKFTGSQQYFNFTAQNATNNSYFPSSNFNCGTSNYQNCASQVPGANSSGSNMNSNFANNFSGSFCNLPLSYYPNSSFYNSYPYFYQGGDMSLLSNHAASLMPSFPSRTSLSPRSSSQSLNDFHLQPSFFPMMPFVSPLQGNSSRGTSSQMSMPLSMRSFGATNASYHQKMPYQNDAAKSNTPNVPKGTPYGVKRTSASSKRPSNSIPSPAKSSVMKTTSVNEQVSNTLCAAAKANAMTSHEPQIPVITQKR